MPPLIFLLALVLAAPLAEARPLPDQADPGPMLVERPESVALLEEGRSQMVTFRLDDAETTFERLDAVETARPAARLHLAKIALWRAMILEQDDLYDAFFDRSDALLDVLKETPDSPWRTHFRAETELHRAVIHAKKTQYARAALALRQAYNHFEKNAKEHPAFYESAWGMGLCHATIGLVPKSFRWVVKMMGFRGTVQQGLDGMAVSARQSVYYRDEAAAFFALTDQLVNESKRGGLAMLREVAARYPESPVVSYIVGYSLINQRRAAEAERELRRAERLLQPPGVFPMPYVDFSLGQALFRQDAFAEAAGYFQRYVRTFPGEALLAQANLHAGLALELSGRRAEAVPYYERVRVRENFDSDAAARREAEARLAAPLSDRERTLLLGGTAFDGGRYAEAVQTLQPVFGDREASEVERAEAAYRSGRAYQLLGTWREALRHYGFAVSNPGDPLAKWGPWSQYYTGEVHEAQGEHARARAAYERALANDDPFAYHKALEQRAKAALDRL
ncbi:MAG: tetratricopeptide repeat protein [Bacteroidota bacterium]